MKLTIKTHDDLSAEQAARKAKAARNEALTYLARTDWLIIRQAETGTPVPQGVLSQRAAARAALSDQP